MKKFVISFTFIIVTTAACLAFIPETNSLLTESDLEYTIVDNQRPAISLPETGKKYFNEWHCMNASDITITTIEIDYDGIKQSPTLFAHFNGKDVEYATDPDINWNVEVMLDHWQNIIKSSEEVCIFSVYLQETPDGDLRYIERIKTEVGIWDRNDDQFVLNEE
jgi:hypothetical protein